MSTAHVLDSAQALELASAALAYADELASAHNCAAHLDRELGYDLAHAHHIAGNLDRQLARRREPNTGDLDNIARSDAYRLANDYYIGRDRELTTALRAYAGSLANDVAAGRARELVRARALDLSGARASVREIADGLADARERVVALANDATSARALASVGILTLDLSSARASARELGNGRACALVDGRIGDYKSALARAHARGNAFNRILANIRVPADAPAGAHADTTADHSVSGLGQSEAGQIAASATHLLAAATRLLPTNDRKRYYDEFISELWELAQLGGRTRQLRYALRQLCSALKMSAALRSPRRRSAGL